MIRLAGVFLSQIGNVAASLGQRYIVDSFKTVVIGGVGSLIGTVVSALGIGVVDRSLQQILGNPVHGKILVLVGKHDVASMSEYEIYRLGIGRKFQTPTVYTDHSGEENLVLSLEGARGVWHSHFAKLSSTQSDRITEILKTTNLTQHRTRTGRSSGSKSGCCSHKMRASCSWTNPPPA